MELEARDKNLKHQQLTAQPLPILVGSLNNISACYVDIDNIKYNLSTPLKAIDICFKLFHALNAQYPKYSEHVWQFIEAYVYEMHSPKKCVNKLIAVLK